MQKPSIKQYVKSTRNLREHDNFNQSNPFKNNFASIDFKRESLLMNQFNKLEEKNSK